MHCLTIASKGALLKQNIRQEYGQLATFRPFGPLSESHREQLGHDTCAHHTWRWYLAHWGVTSLSHVIIAGSANQLVLDSSRLHSPLKISTPENG